MRLFGNDNRPAKRLPTGVGGLLALIIALVVWELAALAVDASYILPTPQLVLIRGAELVVMGEFWASVFSSLGRILLGFLIGMIGGIALAVIMAAAPRARAVFAPFIKVLRTVPVVCFILLMLLWIASPTLPVVISALMVLPVAWTDTIESLDAIGDDVVEVARVFHIGAGTRIFKLYLPAIASQLLSTSVICLSLAWKSGITAEVLSLPFLGIGSEIYHAKMALDAPDIFVWTIAIIILSLALEYALRALEKWLESRMRRSA